MTINWSRGAKPKPLVSIHSQYEVQLERLMQMAGLVTPEKQFMFAREWGRLYRWDFAWPADRLAVEVDGGRFMGRGGQGAAMSRTAPIGHHGSTDDNRKRNLANLLGWKLLVYDPQQIRSGEAIAEIKLALEQAAGMPWQDRLRAHVKDVFDREAMQRTVQRARKKQKAELRQRVGKLR